MLSARTTTPLIAALVLAFPLASAPAGGGAQAQSGNTFEWRGTVLQGNMLEIKGVNGDVRAEVASGGQAEVVATKSSRRSDIASVRIEVVEHGGGVTLCAVYPDTEQPSQRMRPRRRRTHEVRDNDVKVSFVVRVPPGARFVGKTVNGDVTTASLSGPVSLRTVNGSVEFSTSGSGDASTVNGEIRAALGSAIWEGRLEFSTVNGGISLELPQDLQTDVRARTVNGIDQHRFPGHGHGPHRPALAHRHDRRRRQPFAGTGNRQRQHHTEAALKERARGCGDEAPTRRMI